MEISRCGLRASSPSARAERKLVFSILFFLYSKTMRCSTVNHFRPSFTCPMLSLSSYSYSHCSCLSRWCSEWVLYTYRCSSKDNAEHPEMSSCSGPPCTHEVQVRARSSSGAKEICKSVACKGRAMQMGGVGLSKSSIGHLVRVG